MRIREEDEYKSKKAMMPQLTTDEEIQKVKEKHEIVIKAHWEAVTHAFHLLWGETEKDQVVGAE